MNVEEELIQLRSELDAVRAQQDILACIHRYTRGVDRMDEELLRSAYHGDGVDFHDGMTLPPDEFVRWYWGRQRDQEREISQHWVSNATISVDGDTAHCETYYMGVLRNRGADCADLHGGRYVDRLERREGVWRIAVRVSIPEWHILGQGRGSPPHDAGVYLGSRDKADISYERPLQRRNPAEV